MTLPDVSVVGQRLDQARSAILPSLGATTYDFNRSAIATLPQGDNAPLNQTLLQAPGVAQDSFGQVHVRGDHNEVQYRLDGVQLPEGLSVFGQALENRFAHSLSLLTGALPAQYGFLTAGVVDITTKTGRTDPGGEISIYGGARDYLQPSFQYGGQLGSVDYFVTGDLLHSRVGIENPDPTFNAGARPLQPVPRPGAPVRRARRQHPRQPDRRRLQRAVPDPQQPQPVALARAVGQRRQRLHQRQPHRAPARDHRLRHRAAAEADGRGGRADLRLHPLQQPVLHARPGRRPAVHRHRADRRALRHLNWRADRRQLEGQRQPHAARRLPGAGRARRLRHRLLRAAHRRHRRPAIGPAVQHPRRLGQDRQPVRALPAGRVAHPAQRSPSTTARASTASSEYDTETRLSPRVNVVWRPTGTTTVHAGYSRYFTPPPFELVAGTLGRTVQRHQRGAPADAGQRGQGRARQLLRRGHRARCCCPACASAWTATTSRPTT